MCQHSMQSVQRDMLHKQLPESAMQPQQPDPSGDQFNPSFISADVAVLRAEPPSPQSWISLLTVIQVL